MFFLKVNSKFNFRENMVNCSYIEEYGVFFSSDSEMRKSTDSGQDHFANAESVEFAGKAIVKLAMDPKRVEKTGKIILVCDLAKEYG